MNKGLQVPFIIDKGLQFNGLKLRKSTDEIYIHHSGSSVMQSVESIHNYHKSKDWAGIGYHFYIRKDGKCYKGRPENTIGAHCYGHNANSIGICFEGNFEEEVPTEEQYLKGKEIVSYLMNKYSIKKVLKHKDVANTACPGKNFNINRLFEENMQKTTESHSFQLFKNGSTPEKVYSDILCTNKIGMLNPYETCSSLGTFMNKAIVLYKVDNSSNYKIGFTKYLGGIK